MPNAAKDALDQASDAIPGQRAFRFPWQRPTPGEKLAETLDTVSGKMNAAQLTQRAASAADRATEAAGQLTAVLDRLARGQGTATAASVVRDDGPGEVEIRLGDAAQGPLMRAVAMLARAVSSAGEALYDYSGGQYGLPPLEAKEVRNERKKERERAQPVALVEVERPSAQRRSWLPIAGGIIGLVLGATALAIWQRQRLQAAAKQATELGKRTAQQAQQQIASRTSRTPGLLPGGQAGYTSTPAFDRVVHGELLTPTTATRAPSGDGAGGSAPTKMTPPGPPEADTLSE